jgi:hypothetical protein
MIRLAFVLAVILPLASPVANAQSSEGQQPEAPPPGAQAPGAQAPAAQPPEAQQPGAPPPASQQPEAPPPASQQPGAPGAQPSEAQPPGTRRPASRIVAACGRELAKFCSQVRPGGGRLWRCVRQHFSALSPTCQQLVVTGGQR